MGLDINSLNLMEYAKNTGADFNRILSIGRAGISISKKSLIDFLILIGREELCVEANKMIEFAYFEGIANKVYGATVIDSVDASNYEGATITHDLNTPFQAEKKYSVVLDFGCLEHIFNFPFAVNNIINSCEENGHILHYLPANNCCGHGFYQFSPELFYSLYSRDRGFEETKVFFVEWQVNSDIWYEIMSPIDLKSRVNIVNSNEGYLLVKTKKLKNAVSPLKIAPQQSDYIGMWSNIAQFDKNCPKLINRAKSIFKNLLIILGLEKNMEKFSLYLWYKKKMLKASRADIRIHNVRNLIGKLAKV